MDLNSAIRIVSYEISIVVSVVEERTKLSEVLMAGVSISGRGTGKRQTYGSLCFPARPEVGVIVGFGQVDDEQFDFADSLSLDTSNGDIKFLRAWSCINI